MTAVVPAPRLRGGVASAPLFGLAFGCLFGVVLTLRILQIEQNVNLRTASAIAVLVTGAIAAGVIAATIGHRLARRWPAWLRFAVMAVGLVCGALFMSGGLYSVLIRDILDRFDMDDLTDTGGIVDFLFSHGSAAYLMLLGGWNLLFPWPLPVASVAAAFLFATRRL